MTVICLVLIFLALTDAVPTKRNAFQFNDMIYAATGYSGYSYYRNYGCYCGLGGKGTPVDGTDQCCKEHDACYGEASANECKNEWNPNIWESYSFCLAKQDGKLTIHCGPDNGECEDKLCTCDKVAALCFKEQRDKGEYHDENFRYQGKC